MRLIFGLYLFATCLTFLLTAHEGYALQDTAIVYGSIVGEAISLALMGIVICARSVPTLRLGPEV